MESVPLTTLTAQDFNTWIEPESGFNALLGSGISRWGPNPSLPNSRGEIPTGQDIATAIVDALFSSTPTPNASDMAEVKQLLERFPFEAVFDCCPDIHRAENFVRTLCSGAAANPVHHAFAKLAREGIIKSIVTTNYDLGLDDALQASANPIVKIVDPPVTAPARAYFKIHGCVDSRSPLVISLRREGMMPPLKKQLLRSLLNGRPLLVVGYSGLDFEVCPEIPGVGTKRVVWNFFKEKDALSSPGLKRLEEAGTEVHVVLGSMARILELLGHPVTLQEPSSRVSEVRSLLEANFSPEERLLWRVTMLNFIGHARLARAALAALRSPPDSDAARCAFHEGRYRTSMNGYLRASQLAPCDRSRRLALVEAADAARCLGARRRAERFIDTALDGLEPALTYWSEVRGRSLLKRILVQRERHLIATKMRRLKKADRLREQAIPWFAEAAARTLDAGDIPEWQQLRFWAERMSVPAEVLRPNGSHAPPTTQIGYRHLGYELALNMELADRARTGFVPLLELQQGLAKAEDFGSHPQAWKLCHAIIRRFPRQLLPRLPHLISHFRACEYTLLRRVLGVAGGS